MIKKFYIFSLFWVVFLVAEILYLSSFKTNFKDEKLEFVRQSGVINFAFFSDTPYQRHPQNFTINSIHITHPAFREKDLASFINSGYSLR